MNWFPVLLVVHIVLAISLFLPSFLLLFALRAPRHTDLAAPSESPHGPFVRVLLWLQGNWTLAVGLGLGLTGIGLVTYLGTQVLTQPWLFTALLLYAANLVIAFFIQRPALRRLLGLRSDASPAEQARWRVVARRQRYISYVMAAAIGLIAFLMNAKPGA